MLRKARNRERKRFHRILCTDLGVVSQEDMKSNTLQMSWNVTRKEVERVLEYWNRRSALERCDIADLLAEKYGNLTRQRTEARRRRQGRSIDAVADHSQELTLVVWDLPRLVREHALRYMPIRTKDGWYRPPLVITASDLIPLTFTEMTVLHRRSCRKLAEFCRKLIAPEAQRARAAAVHQEQQPPASESDPATVN